MLDKLAKELGAFWYLIVAVVTLAWYLSQAHEDISHLKVNDEKQNAKIEAINSDITQIKVDTSYIRARIDGQIPPQKLR